jgi:hypothetical protein
VQAVSEFGSSDAAAERLHLTPSAVSQRIKSLEQRVGQVLVMREKPCRATAAGPRQHLVHEQAWRTWSVSKRSVWLPPCKDSHLMSSRSAALDRQYFRRLGAHEYAGDDG